MNYYNFHIGDYLKQTAHLTPMEDICYRRLLDMYYETEAPIPPETDRVSRRLRLDIELVNSVLQEFFFLTENGWVNARCDVEISAYQTKVSTARNNGKLGGRPKKTSSVPKKTQSVSDRNPRETGSKANQEPITNNQYIHADAPFHFKTALLEHGVDSVLADDWLRVRKTKKATNTRTALTKFVNEVERAGWTVPAAVKHCVEKDWKGFDAEWVKETPKPAPAIPFDREAYEARRRAEAEAAKERMRQEAAA